jgi:hypothetical protein
VDPFLLPQQQQKQSDGKKAMSFASELGLIETLTTSSI